MSQILIHIRLSHSLSSVDHLFHDCAKTIMANLKYFIAKYLGT